MLFEDEKSETLAINYILNKSQAFVLKMVLTKGGTQENAYTILNDGLVILINNIRASKFKTESSLHTYYIGICKLLWKRLKAKNQLYVERFSSLENRTEGGEFSELIEKFEQQNENKERLNFIYSLITDKCRDVLDLWARGFNMTEIKDKMEYKSAQIAMNKKNTCLKQLVRLISNARS